MLSDMTSGVHRLLPCAQRETDQRSGRNKLGNLGQSGAVLEGTVDSEFWPLHGSNGIQNLHRIAIQPNDLLSSNAAPSYALFDAAQPATLPAQV